MPKTNIYKNIKTKAKKQKNKKTKKTFSKYKRIMFIINIILQTNKNKINISTQQLYYQL